MLSLAAFSNPDWGNTPYKGTIISSYVLVLELETPASHPAQIQPDWMEQKQHQIHLSADHSII